MVELLTLTPTILIESIGVFSSITSHESTITLLNGVIEINNLLNSKQSELDYISKELDIPLSLFLNKRFVVKDSNVLYLCNNLLEIRTYIKPKLAVRVDIDLELKGYIEDEDLFPYMKQWFKPSPLVYIDKYVYPLEVEGDKVYYSYTKRYKID
jgi:hypothetical protein